MALLSRWHLLSLRFFISGRYVSKPIGSQMFLVLHFSFLREVDNCSPQAASLSPHRFVMCKVILSFLCSSLYKTAKWFSDPDSSSRASWSSLLMQHCISVRLPQAHLSPHCQLRGCFPLSAGPGSAAQVALRDWFWVSVFVAWNKLKTEKKRHLSICQQQGDTPETDCLWTSAWEQAQGCLCQLIQPLPGKMGCFKRTEIEEW